MVSAALQPHSIVVIGSAPDLNRCWWRSSLPTLEQTCFLEVPQGGSLTLMHLLFLIAHGAGRVVILASSESGNAHLQRAVAEANLLCNKFLNTNELVTICTPEDLGSHLSQDGSTELSFRPYCDLSFVNRRHELSSILGYLSAASESDITLEENEVRFIDTIVCDDERCTQCLACLNSCKIESLSADNATYSICWNGSLCVGCQSCVEACPEEALTYRGGAVLTADYFRPVEVSRADPMVCEGCGKVFGTKKSFEKVMAILTAKQKTPAEHLHYCEDCRVVKLLEDQ